MEQITPKLIGARIKRTEDRRLLTGQGAYVDDHQPSGLVHAAFLRSPYPHARITHLDISAARALDGIVAVITGEELAQAVKPVRAGSTMADYKETSFPPLAVDKVRFVGEAVAVVVAQSRYLAEDGLEQIDIEYEPLEAVVDVQAASAVTTPSGALLHEEAQTNVILSRQFAAGDVDAAMESAAVRVTERFRFHRHAAVCMENRGCLAEYHAGTETLTLRSATQCPGLIRDALAELLDIPEHSVRVVAADVGGGFGAKSSLYGCIPAM